MGGPIEWFNSSLSPDGSYYAIGTRERGALDATLSVYDLRLAPSKRGVPVIVANDLGMVSAFAVAGGRVAVCSHDQGRIMNLTGSQPPVRFGDTPGEFDIVALSPDGGLVATTGRSGVITVWDANDGKPTFSFRDQDVTSLLIRSRPRRLISGHSTGTLLIWDLDEVTGVITKFKRRGDD
jgi:WD40 repeat protein